jgi:hypothetical protein
MTMLRESGKLVFFRAEELGGERGDLGLGGEQGAREQYNR